MDRCNTARYNHGRLLRRDLSASHRFCLKSIPILGVMWLCWSLIGPGAPAYAQETGAIKVDLRADPPSGVDVDIYTTNLATPRAPIYVGGWGEMGGGPGQLGIPVDMAVTNDGRVHIADRGQCSIHQFDESGQYLTSWTNCGLSSGAFYDLDAIAVGGDGAVFVADRKLFQTDIHRFDRDGNHELTWQIGYSFVFVGSMTVDQAGHLYVTAANQNGVRKYDRDGNMLLSFGSSGTADGRFSVPLGIATDRENNVYVVDSGNGRVQKFSDQGVHLATWRSAFLNEPLPARLSDIAVDSAGFVYVSDSANHRLYKFTRTGDLVVVWGEQGTSPGQFDGPIALVVNDQDGLLVLDTAGVPIQTFRDSHRSVDHAIPDDGDVITSTVQFDALAAGDYLLTTRLPYGWTYDGMDCSDVHNVPIPDGRGITLQSGTTVSCTIDIAGPGQMRFENEVVDGAALPTAWTYDIVTTTAIAGLPTSIQLSEPITLPRGSYTVTVTGPNGYAITSTAGPCSRVNGQLVVTSVTNQAAICTVRYATISEVRITEAFGVTFVAEGEGIPEDGATCFWLTSSTRPDAPITLSVRPRGDEVRADRSRVALDTHNWHNLGLEDDSNRVCIQAIEDDIADDVAEFCKDAIVERLGTATIDSVRCGDHVDYVDIDLLSSLDPAYTAVTPFTANTTLDLDGDPKSVDILIRNNDEVGVRFTPAYGFLYLDEAGMPVGDHCYWVNLTSQPVRPVTITVRAIDAEIAVNQSVLTFDAINWSFLDPRVSSNQVCIVPVDDATVDAHAVYCTPRTRGILADGEINGEVCGDHIGHIVHTLTSEDPRYDGLSVFQTPSPDFDADPRTLDVVIRDDDQAGVRFSPLSVNTVEGSTARYTVTLTSQPSAPVLVVQGDRKLEFTPERWQEPQTFIVRTWDNDIVDGNRTRAIGHEVFSDDTDYDELVLSPVALYIADDDSAGIELSTPDATGRIQVREGGTPAVYSLRLTAAPTTPLTITLRADPEIRVIPTSLVFDAHNWNQWQQIVVEATDDPLIEEATHPSALTHVLDGDDPAYQTFPGPTLSVDVLDNDKAALIVDAAPSLVVTEAGTTSALLHVRLASRPTAPVTVQLDGAPQLAVEPATLSIMPDRWDQRQTITIRGVDNMVDTEQDESGIVVMRLESSDPDFNNLFKLSQPVTILDDDRASLVIKPLRHEVRTGDTAIYSLVLSSQPTAPVIVTARTVEADSLQFEPPPCVGVDTPHATCLVFSPDNWNVHQTIQVRRDSIGAVDIDHAVVSEDAPYAALGNVRVSVMFTSVPTLPATPTNIYLPYLRR